MFTVLWDNDGVLVDTEGLYFRACRNVLTEIGVELTVDVYREISLRQGQSTFRLAAEQGVDDHRLAQLRARRDDLYVDLLRARSPVIPGAEECLRSLYGKVRMGVVTSARRAHFELAHAWGGLLKYLDFAVTLEDYRRTKPHPDSYLAALARERLHPDACLAVEDTPRGLAAATAAGLRCVVVRSEWTCGLDFNAAHRVVDAIAEVGPEALQLCRQRGSP